MNTAATAVAITEVFLAIMAPLQRASDRKVHAAAPARCAVLSILLSGTYLTLNRGACTVADGLVASMTGSEEADVPPILSSVRFRVRPSERVGH